MFYNGVETLWCQAGPDEEKSNRQGNWTQTCHSETRMYVYLVAVNDHGTALKITGHGALKQLKGFCKKRYKT